MSTTGKIYEGCICCYDACTCNDCVCGCTHSEECLCCIDDMCCSLNCKENLGCGMVTQEENKECCKIGCVCLRVGCKTPDKCCGQANQCFCIKSVAAFPMDKRFIPEPVCAFCCLTCAPECGCCVDAPACPALNEDPVRKSMKMERD